MTNKVLPNDRFQSPLEPLVGRDGMKEGKYDKPACYSLEGWGHGTHFFRLGESPIAIASACWRSGTIHLKLRSVETRRFL